MSDFEHHETEQSDRLDEVVLRLRGEAVPPMPPELLGTPPRRKSMNSRAAAIGFVVAASILFLAVLFSRPSNPEPSNVSLTGTDKAPTVVPVAQLDPYGDMETELSEMKEEIAELRRRAELLDVYRRVDSLLAKN